MSHPEVSVIIPVYNEEAGLPPCSRACIPHWMRC